jgi:hypothetical protein
MCFNFRSRFCWRSRIPTTYPQLNMGKNQKVKIIHHEHFIIANTAKYVLLMGMPVDVLSRFEHNAVTMEWKLTYTNYRCVASIHVRGFN